VFSTIVQTNYYQHLTYLSKLFNHRMLSGSAARVITCFVLKMLDLPIIVTICTLYFDSK